jgi:hypothetical protein
MSSRFEMSTFMPSFSRARNFSWRPCAPSLTSCTQPDVIGTNLFFFFSSLASSSVFLKRILDSGPTGYYVLELEAQVATLMCLVVFLLAKIAYGYFPPWRDGVFGYLKL